jgi:hypothetical protein
VKFDLSKFKKIHEDLHSSTLRHPEGHEIRIAKSGLSSKLKSQLASLPVFKAEGGEIEVPVNMNASPTLPDQLPGDAQLSKPEPLYGLENMDQDQIKTQSAAPTNYPLDAMRQPSQAPVQMPDAMAGYKSAIGTIQQGLNQGVQATEQQAQGIRAGAQGYQNSMGELQKHWDQKSQELDSERAALLNDYKNGHIDPNHYWSDKSTGGKVATAIGLILGGIGGGLTHQENPALKFLNAQIDRDVEGQKENLGKTKTLLEANMHQYGNLRDATSATRIMMGDLYKAKLEEAAAKAATPQAKAAALQALGQLKLQLAPAEAEFKNRQAIMGGLQSGRVNPELAVRYLVPEKDHNETFKELQLAQNHRAQSQMIMKSFEDANQNNTVGGRVTHAGYEPASVAAIQTAMMPYLKDAEGRINESELARTDALIPRPGDSQTKINAKRAALQNFLKEKASFPRLRAYGISVPEVDATPIAGGR